MKTLIIGAGISGLSCAFNLEQRGNKNYLLLEAAPKAGGLCGSYQEEGFTFDYSGHLLHLATKQGLKLIEKLLGKNVIAHKRKAFIITRGKEVPFPFQNNLYGLDEDLVSRCVNGALSAYKDKPYKRDGSFKNWALALYGKPICDCFMFPYNTKLWQFDLGEMTDEWCGKFVPASSLEDIIKGAYSRRRKDFGYNTTFLYPQKGGCQALCDALAGRVSNLKLNNEVTKIDIKRKAVLAGEQEIPYQNLVSTMPLNRLGKIIKGLPAAVKEDFAKLKHNTVKVLNIAAEGKTKEGHWYYFPDEDLPFYRIGIQSSFSPFSAPKGCCSFYVECGDIKIDEKLIIKKMREMGFLEEAAKILFTKTVKIQTAYPIYDGSYKTALKNIIDYLTEQNIYLLGRYGAWEYSFMEKSLLEGEALAVKLNEITCGELG